MNEALFLLTGYINSQNICDWDTENAHYLPVPLHNENVGVWCGINARRIISLMFFMTHLVQNGM
jgi:hypothetical protein